MARQITDIRDFLKIARRKDARRVVVLRKTVKPKNASFYSQGGGTLVTKFKIRCSKCLYTMVIDDKAKAQKLESSLPPFLQKKNIPA